MASSILRLLQTANEYLTASSYPSISEILPNKYRSIGLASTELQTLPWSTFGPLIGRALVEHATWRWNFYLGIISAVFAATGTFFFFNPPSKPIRDRTRWQIFRELDHLGLALYTAGITLFLLGLSWGGIQHPWKSAAVIAPLILGVVLLGLCIAWDFSGYPKRPIFPKRIFVMFREFVAVLAVMFVTGLVYISGASLIPLQIGYVWTSDPIKAGLYNICAGFGGSIGGVVLGSLIYRIKRVPLQFGVAITVQTLFTALLALVTPHRIAMGIVFQTLASIPFGWVLILCYVTVGLHIPQRDLGLAAGLVGASRFLGGAVGSTILFTIFDNKAATAVPQHVAAAATQLGYPVSKVPGLLGALSSGNSSELANVPSNVLLAAVDALKWGYNSAFVVTWLATIPFGVLALLFGVFIRDPSPYFTTHVAVKTGDEKQGKHHQSAEERGATEKEVPLPSHIEA